MVLSPPMWMRVVAQIVYAIKLTLLPLWYYMCTRDICCNYMSSLVREYKSDDNFEEHRASFSHPIIHVRDILTH